MNNNIWNKRHITGIRIVLGSAALACAFTSLGCSGEKPFAKINGVTVTQDEYLHTLERQNVVIPGGQTTNAERLVIDQLVGNKIIIAEAIKENVVPSEEEVNNYYTLQKKLFENQFPGKNYETSMKEQGTTAEDVKSDMKYQLAEANLYAKKLGITEKDVRDAFDKVHGQIGLPARVQLRLVLVAPNSADFLKAQQLLNNKTPFDEVAKQINPPQLRVSGGLIAQATPVNTLGQQYQTKVQQSPEGASFGPVDFRLAANQPAAKAWVKIEKKLPALNLTIDDAGPLVKRQLVQMKLADPANQNARNDIVKAKLAAKFEPTDTSYTAVWDALRKTAEESGLGQNSAPAAPVVGAPTTSLTAPAPGVAPAPGGK